jgi:hypothetical protein
MLTPEHRKQLEAESGILPQVIEARGYCSVKADDPALAPWAKAQRQEGLLIPSYDIFQKRLPGQLRPDYPRTMSSGGKLREIKYEGPRGGHAYVDVHPAIWDAVRHTSKPLIITEGVKKADSMISRGVLCLALLGVWSWRGKTQTTGTVALPDWDQLPMDGRRIILAYDDDVMTKGPVKHAIKRLSHYLQRHGAQTYILDWNRL